MRSILFLFVFIINSTFAQTKAKTSYPVYINYPDYTVKADVLSEPKKISVHEELTYYWYSSNKILETRGDYDGKILCGSYISYYLSKNLKEKGSFKNGLKNSQWISWNADGKINEVISWKNGVMNGSYKKYDVFGDLIEESTYRQGKLNGYKITYEKEKIQKKEKYRKGILIVPKEKKQKDPAAGKKEKRGLFKQKDKPKEETAPANAAKTPKKTVKERWQSLFKKKEKLAEPKNKPEEPSRKRTKDQPLKKKENTEENKITAK